MGVGMHAFNPSIYKAETGRSLQVRGQHGLHSHSERSKFLVMNISESQFPRLQKTHSKIPALRNCNTVGGIT